MDRKDKLREQKADEFLEKVRVPRRGGKINPNEYILLLTINTLLKKDEGHENRFTFTELEPIFLAHYNAYFPDAPAYSKMLEYPFYHMKNDGFWFFHIKESQKEKYLMYEKTGMTKKRFLETVEYAYLDRNIYEFLCHQENIKIFEDKIATLLSIDSLKDVRYLIAAREHETEDIYVKEGSSLFEHEQLAIETIRNSINRQQIGQIISNILIYDDQSNNYYEYDLILVAHSGIYVIELKHWSGHIRIKPYNWIVNDAHHRTDPHKSNIFKCKILKGIYQHNFRTYPNVWVESIVVLTNPESTVDGAAAPGIAISQQKNKPTNPTFASISDLITYLKKKESSSEDQLLDNQQINAIISYLNGLVAPKQQIKYEVPGYETVEYLSQKPECIELIARPIDGRAKGLTRFRVFRTPFQATTEEKERFMKKAYSTLNTVSQIEDHPNIQKVWIIENECGDIIEGSDWPETGTLSDLICQQEGAFPIEDTVRICHGILLGLSEAHQLGVIHRAVNPENILMFNGIPKLINFDLAYQLEENRLTVIPDASQLKDDGYIAPEVLFGEDIDDSTDLFSLGVITYEMLTGSKPFNSVRDFVAQGGTLNDKLQGQLYELGLPEECTEIIIDMIVADRAKRFKDVESAIEVFSEKGKQGTEPQTINARLHPGDKYDVYEILEQIGEGRETQIYKARTLRGLPVVLKLFNKEVPQERIFNEAEITSAINSSYVVNSDNKIGHWKNDRFFLVMDYIRGKTIRQKIENNDIPDIDTFRTIAFCLIEAVKSFHLYKDQEGNSKQLLHSDIKPDNIIITPDPDSKAVLIDCGIAGEPRVDVFQGTNGYVPPDSIRGTDMEFSESGDIFALGVTLWEWLFGEKPYVNPTVGDIPSIPKDLSEDVIAYIPWLKKAVATETEQRFKGIQEMQDAFVEHHSVLGKDSSQLTQDIADDSATEDTVVTQMIANPFVDYINSLSEASAGNENAIAESQLASDFFDRIFVENPLSDFIYKSLVSDKIHVILTGNAGDGKTTIAANIYKKITGEYPKILQPKIHIDNIVIVKDMSELPHQDQRAGVINDALKDESNRYLIVSNTGTLLECFRELKINGKEKEAYESELLKALESDRPQFVLNNHFMVINIANMDSIDTACQVFERMLDIKNWNACEKCLQHEKCPIFSNVQLLHDDLQRISDRVKLLYRRLYEYDIRLTMRQMTGHLAYAITAGKNCADVNTMSVIALESCLHGSLFFNRFFGDDGNEIIPETRQLLPVRRIRNAEFGTLLDPYFERKAWAKDNAELPLSGKALGISNNLLKRNDSSTRRQMRRLVYFYGTLDDESGKRYISTFLRSPMLIEFIEYSQGITTIPKIKEERYRNQILQVLQEYFVGVRLPEGIWQEQNLYITLRPFENSAGTQMSLATFRREDFRLDVKDRYYVRDNNNSHMVCLCHKNSDVEMPLSLPFLDYIARRYEGEMAEELSAYYANRLEQFKVELLDIYNKQKEDKEDYLTLIRIRYGGGFEVIKVHVAGKSLEVFS